jgi:protein-S-isoprenylcysteine O-methyltransferase Ste14
VLGAALFVPAGTVAYWQAWVFLAVFTAAVTAITIDLAIHDPALLARRTHAGPIAETSSRQKLIQSLASLAFLALFVISALDHRGAWSRVPAAIAIAGDALVILGLGIVFRVFRVNTFTSAVIAVEREQHVIPNGPYAHVRHPMYAGALVMLVGVPLALGSWWGLVALPPMVAVLVWRLVDEERVLATDLAGYTEYRARVRYRLMPGVW